MGGARTAATWVAISIGVALATSATPSQRLCATKNVDCSAELLPNATHNCTVKHYTTNSSDCFDMDFDTENTDQHRLGNVLLKPYMWDYQNKHLYVYTIFNVVFTGIEWNHIKFRFEAVKSNRKKYKNHCREIFISNARNAVYPYLNYDCHWSDQDAGYENETFVFDYLAENGPRKYHKKYIFIVPPPKMLNPAAVSQENFPFLYVDITDKKNIDLHITSLFGIIESNKIITVETCTIEYDRSPKLIVCKSENITGNNETEIIYTLNPETSGWYFFNITINHSVCGKRCPHVSSAEFYIDLSNIVYTILWNVLYILSFFILCIVIWCIIKKLRRHSPNVLLLHTYNDKTHKEIINLMRTYMQNELKWSVMWDEDIETTEHSDPYIWCFNACMNADCILYVVSPISCGVHLQSVSDSSHEIHMHMEEIFFKALKVTSRKKKITVYNVVLEICGEADFPAELTSIRTFNILSEWYKLINRVLKNDILDKYIQPIPLLNSSNLGKNLQHMLRQAANIDKSNSTYGCDRNK